MNSLKLSVGLLLAASLFVSCKKSFLDEKPNTKIITPKTLQDFVDLLNNEEVMNYSGVALSSLSSDEYYYLSRSAWQNAFSITERNAYVWATDVFGGEVNRPDWNLPYKAIFYANSVLDAMEQASPQPGTEAMFNNVKGWALFFRAFYFFDLARNFTAQYDEATADTEMGIPLRLKPQIDEIQPRASLRETYYRIIADLDQATILLDTVKLFNQRNVPSRSAAYALKARIYLSMRKYEEAGLNADSALDLDNTLIDYNSLDITNYSPFTPVHDELLFNSINNIYYGATGNTNAEVAIDSNLLNAYDPHDLRPDIYFTETVPGVYNRKRGYDGIGGFPFTGLATDELYLIKAESQVRTGDFEQGIATLNVLLINRYTTGEFTPVEAASQEEALDIVLTERWKELVFRGLRWSDLKRLNKEGRNIVLVRNLDGENYTLMPNSPRYIFNIPADEIAMSGIQQNPRD